MSGSSMVFTKNEGLDSGQARPGIRVLSCTWVSDSAAGTASATTGDQWVGEVVKVVTIPATSASGNEPTNDYTVTITESVSGLDITTDCKLSLASNQSQAPSGGAQCTYLLVESYDTTTLCLAVRPAICDKLTVAVSGAGNSKAGVIQIYVRTFK
jgi:hypothetical protein